MRLSPPKFLKRVVQASPSLASIKPYLALFAIVLVSWLFSHKNTQNTTSITFQIKPGDNVSTIARRLKESGEIRSITAVKALARTFGFEEKVKPGVYELKPNMSLIAMLIEFSYGDVKTTNITLVEGLTISQYYHQLNNHPALTSSGDLVDTLAKAGIDEPAEGKLWPETYQINNGDTVASVFARAAKVLEDKLEDAWANRAEDLPYQNPEEALVLGSLIEKETAHVEEKSRVAGVFIKRLKTNMYLQSDASVIYAMGPDFTPPLKKNHLEVNNAHNTYRFKGLPPSAISSVSESSLNAAMHPELGESLYFVAKKDGTHAFSVTYSEHRQNIRKYLMTP